MDKSLLYLSTIDPAAQTLARRYGLGLEIAEFCTAQNMDSSFAWMDGQVRQKLEEIPNRIFHGPFNELFPCAIDPRARALAADRYHQAMTLARSYGIDRMILHGGYMLYVYYPQWYVEQSVLFWKDFLRDVPRNFTVLLENVLEPEPELLRDIAAGVDDPRLRLCLDVGHVNVYSKIPVWDWLECWAPYLGHFHIHNNDGSWDTHSSLYEGTIDIRALLARAEELCPEATYTLELPDAAPSLRALLEE